MSPRRGPPVTTAIWNDDIRLRMVSGTDACSTVLRSTAEMTSAHPATARRMSASHRDVGHAEEGDGATPRHHGGGDGHSLPAQVRHPAREEGAPQGPRPRRGVEETEHRRLGQRGVEAMGGQGGEERPGHAEDHGVDVDQEDALKDMASLQVAHPFQDRTDPRPGRPRRRRDAGDGQARDGADGVGAGVDPVHAGQPDRLQQQARRARGRPRCPPGRRSG